VRFHWVAVFLGWLFSGLISTLGITVYFSVSIAQTWTEETENTGLAFYLWLALLIKLGLPAGCVSAVVGGILLPLSRVFARASVVKAVAVGLCYLVLTAVVDVHLITRAYESYPLPGHPTESAVVVVILQGVAALSVVGTLVIDWSLMRSRAPAARRLSA
jgi:hypothetical protein